MKTNVYVDGFNLYYGCFRDRTRPHLGQYKWLDLRALSESLLPGATVHRIKYFTARVSGTPNDPNQPVRQQAYLDALRTIPKLQVIEGTFRKTQK